MPKRCIEPGCDDLPYGPRAHRCFKHHEERARENNKQDKRKRREEMVAKGICTQCGTRQASPGLRTCQRCRDRQKSYRMEFANGRAVKSDNARKTVIQRDITRAIVNKVIAELVEMRKYPTEAWDFNRIRQLGFALAQAYLYQRGDTRISTVRMMGKSGSGSVAKLIAEIDGLKLIAQPRRERAKEREARAKKRQEEMGKFVEEET